MTDKEKIQKQIKIPIDKINIHSSYVQIFSDEVEIGSIPFFEVKGIKTYDTDEKILNKLNWYAVYDKNKIQIDEKIQEKIKENSPTITLGTFRRLYVKNPNGDLISTISCEFDEDWTVYVE